MTASEIPDVGSSAGLAVGKLKEGGVAGAGGLKENEIVAAAGRLSSRLKEDEVSIAVIRRTKMLWSFDIRVLNSLFSFIEIFHLLTLTGMNGSP